MTKYLWRFQRRRKRLRSRHGNDRLSELCDSLLVALRLFLRLFYLFQFLYEHLFFFNLLSCAPIELFKLFLSLYFVRYNSEKNEPWIRAIAVLTESIHYPTFVVVVLRKRMLCKLLWCKFVCRQLSCDGIISSLQVLIR